MIRSTVWSRLGALIGWLLMFIAFSLALGLPGRVAGREATAGLACDPARLNRLETDFRRLSERPGSAAAEETRAAAVAYIAAAEACYQAASPTGQGPSRIIDEGGLWAPGAGPPGRDTPSAQSALAGTKWPSGTFDKEEPPGRAGGTVTYSYMPGDVITHGVERVEGIFEPGPNIDVRAGLGVDDCVEQEIRNAFAAWSAVADIQFVEVEDNGLPSDAVGATGQIRIGAHIFFNPSRLAHAFFPPPNGVSLGGDLHFNSAVKWTCADPAIDEVDIGLVALHEIGHTIGLDHEPPDGAISVMNATFNARLLALQPDDRAGVVSIYGARAVLGSRDDGTCRLFHDYKGKALASPAWMTGTLVGTNTTWRYDNDAWVVENSGEAKADVFLASPLLTPTTTGPDYILSFSHRYTTPQSFLEFYDGGVVEISATRTMTWTDVGRANFFKNGYNGQLPIIFGPLKGNPLVDGLSERRWAFAGDSGPDYIESVVNLTGFVEPDDQFQIRFRYGADGLDLGRSATGAWRIRQATLCQLRVIHFPVVYKK